MMPPTSDPNWPFVVDGDYYTDPPSPPEEPSDLEPDDDETDPYPAAELARLQDAGLIPDLDPPGWATDIASHHAEHARKASLYTKAKALADAGRNSEALALLTGGS